ncbi:MAG: protein kinase [Deltaproteobacteria bacterium]|nr:protein kinase [Deltaproteobacteria bacterium]
MSSLDPGEFTGNQRFQVLSWLGDGGMGVVYAALDRERNARVALKALRNLSPEAVRRFKSEFRSLQDIQHENLVSLGELIEADGNWLLTMELVDGVHFLEHVRGIDPAAPPALTPPAEPARLRAALLQVARGLDALHRAGKVHRDIKPSNLLVTREGRVVILDFGFISEEKAQRSDAHVVGTAAYMAPEQAATTRVAPAADLYSLGVILYEALTGQVPLTGMPLEVLMRKQREAPPPPRALAPDAPADLDALCVALLEIAPERRPSAAQVIARLTPQGDAAERPLPSHSARIPLPVRTPPVSHGRGASFVGRARELEELAAALASSSSAPVTVLVEGESGLGKTALVQHFVRTLEEADDVLCLHGRCYERESLPFKAIDGVIDALARHLSRRPAAEVAAVLPRRVGLLLSLFPALRRIEAAAEAPHEVVRDPGEVRSRAFQALRELLQRLCDRRRVVISIDDLQWADADSMALLGELLRPPDAPALLLVATARPGAAAVLPGEVRTLALGTLAPDSARELLVALLRAGGVAAASVDVGALIAEAGGHPLFIEELSRHLLTHGQPASGRQRLEDALWARAQELPPSTRQLLELVAVAGAPLPQELIAQAAGAEPVEFSRDVATLRVGHWVLTAGARPGDTIEPFHDRIRETVTLYLDAATRAQHHHRLALALEGARQPNHEALAVHWQGAGRPELAVHHADEAAGEATRALAFERAARLYGMALELGATGTSERLRLTLGRADALAKLGRGGDAGPAYLEAAALAGGPEALELGRLAADQLLRSGRIEAALSTLVGVLAPLKLVMPATPRRALAWFLWRRARIRLRGLGYRLRAPSALSADELRAVDTCWTIALGLGQVDFMRGASFQALHHLLALDAGEATRIARSFALEAGYAASAGPSAGPRIERLLAEARKLVGTGADARDGAHGAAFITLMGGVSAFLRQRWSEARTLCEQAEAVFREQCLGAGFEIATAQQFALWALVHLGELGEAARRQPVLLREAIARGDQYAQTTLNVGHPAIIMLAADDPEQAREVSRRAMKAWTHHDFQVQHCFDLWAMLITDLYAGDRASALARLGSHWSFVEDSLLLRVQFIRVQMLQVRARVRLAAASLPGAEAGLVEAALADARRLQREDVACAKPMGRVLEASAAELGGDAAGAAAILLETATQFDDVEMRLWSACARLRAAELTTSTSTSTSTEPAAAALRAQGVRKPGRFARSYIPGREPTRK